MHAAQIRVQNLNVITLASFSSLHLRLHCNVSAFFSILPNILISISMSDVRMFSNVF